jgi:growth hormone secretagogue receptor
MAASENVTQPALSGEGRIFSVILFVIDQVIPPVIIAFGLVGNVLAFLVLHQPQYAKQTTCFYMRVLAIFDSMCLLGHVLVRTIINNNPKHMFSYDIGPYVCPILALFFGGYGLSNWTIAAMTFDRFLAVRFPLKAASWCTKRRAKIAVSLISLFFLLVSIPYSIRTVNPEALVAKDICLFEPSVYPPWFHNLFMLIHKFCIFTTPFFIVLLFNISIIITLGLERLRKTESELITNQKTTKKDAHITVLLLLVTAVFFITNIPNTVDRWVWDAVLATYPMTPRLSQIRKMAYDSVVLLLFINPSMNFYTYCLGCKKFRSDVTSIFCKRNATKVPGLSKHSR